MEWSLLEISQRRLLLLRISFSQSFKPWTARFCPQICYEASEVQVSGKDIYDRWAAALKIHITYYINEGNEVKTVSDMKLHCYRLEEGEP